MPQSQPLSRRWAAINTFAGSSASTLIAAVQALVLMPVYLHQVGPKVYGAWLGSGEVLAWMMAFDFGIPNLMIQRIGAAHASNDQKKVGEYFGTGLTTLLILAALLGLSAVLAAPFVSGWMHLRGTEAHTLSVCFSLDGLATAAIIANYAVVGLSRALQNTFTINLANVLGTIVGFGATIYMLCLGMGLYAIAWGLIVRASVGILGSILFLTGRSLSPVIREFRVRMDTLKEFAKISPSLFLSGLAYLVMSNSQVTIAAVLMRPELATVFGLTRKAAELVKSLLDMVGYASYGGFAHLAASGEPRRTRAVYDEIVSTYLTIAIALLGAYAAINPSLITVWVSPKMYGGALLTALTALAMFASGWSYLTISLYRSSGGLVKSSVALLIECAVRVPAMILLTLWLGLPGLPLGTLATSLVSGAWGHWQVVKNLPHSSISAEANRIWIVRTITFAGVLAICPLVMVRNWAFVLVGGTVVAAIAGAILVFTDPLIRNAWIPGLRKGQV